MGFVFNIVQKDGRISNQASVETKDQGNDWVDKEKGSGFLGNFGFNGGVMTLGQANAYGKTIEDAETGFEGVNEIGEVTYKFSSDWTLDIKDTTLEDQRNNEIQDTRSDRQFCIDIIDEMAAFNRSSATDQAVMTLFEDIKFVGIMVALLTGGGKQAKNLIAVHGPLLYPQQVVDYFVAKLDQRFPS